MLTRSRLSWGCKRKPGLPILSMNDQCGRILLFAIHKKDHQLTIALIGSMMRTGTIGMCQARNMQIESLHNAKTSTGQFSIDPCLNLLASLIESQKGQ